VQPPHAAASLNVLNVLNLLGVLQPPTATFVYSYIVSRPLVATEVDGASLEKGANFCRVLSFEAHLLLVPQLLFFLFSSTLC
jgi:hypothetical protein